MDEIIIFLNNCIWSWPLVGLCLAAALYFSFGTRFVQVRHLPEMVRLLFKKDRTKRAGISSFQAFALALSGRVGTGNIVGVALAIGFGGPGAIVWMWIIAFLGAGTAYAEACLAQIYKRHHGDQLRGGPAYYIEKVAKKGWLSMVFCVFLIATYAFGFNLLCSYNLQSSFEIYEFYNPTWSPAVIGAVAAIAVAICLFGGGKRIIGMTEKIVPFMGLGYVLASLIVIFTHVGNIPQTFSVIFQDAFNFPAIFGGLSGSCMVYGIKRGLYSNEAGVGSAPNASASAIDTILLCTATALMCLTSGVEYNAEISGAAYVQNAISTIFGGFGPIFITIAMVMFAFTTLIGNLYYVDNALIYLNKKKKPSKTFMNIFYIGCVAVIFLGALIPMDFAWTMADITMGGMTLINIPVCVALSGIAVRALRDFESQKKKRLNPHFVARDIGLDESELSFWK